MDTPKSDDDDDDDDDSNNAECDDGGSLPDSVNTLTSNRVP